jgi:hypothetical protein
MRPPQRRQKWSHMGLDMYLEKKTYIRDVNVETGKFELRGTMEIRGVDPENATYVIEQIG